MTLLPAATAVPHSDRVNPACARWQATRDEEHAVSVLMHGPGGTARAVCTCEALLGVSVMWVLCNKAAELLACSSPGHEPALPAHP